jgi:hypothetical protein
MISGFNTDILHDGVVYHVQTEDKGRGNPFIESLIYVGGQVVVTKRDSYEDLLDPDQGDQAIAERMDRQHRVLIAAIKSGRFDDQFKALLDGRGADRRGGRCDPGGRLAFGHRLGDRTRQDPRLRP